MKTDDNSQNNPNFSIKKVKNIILNNHNNEQNISPTLYNDIINAINTNNQMNISPVSLLLLLAQQLPKFSTATTATANNITNSNNNNNNDNSNTNTNNYNHSRYNHNNYNDSHNNSNKDKKKRTKLTILKPELPKIIYHRYRGKRNKLLKVRVLWNTEDNIQSEVPITMVLHNKTTLLNYLNSVGIRTRKFMLSRVPELLNSIPLEYRDDLFNEKQ